jgi:hypothetical protein
MPSVKDSISKMSKEEQLDAAHKALSDPNNDLLKPEEPPS